MAVIYVGYAKWVSLEKVYSGCKIYDGSHKINVISTFWFNIVVFILGLVYKQHDQLPRPLKIKKKMKNDIEKK